MPLKFHDSSARSLGDESYLLLLMFRVALLVVIQARRQEQNITKITYAYYRPTSKVVPHTGSTPGGNHQKKSLARPEGWKQLQQQAYASNHPSNPQSSSMLASTRPNIQEASWSPVWWPPIRSLSYSDKTYSDIQKQNPAMRLRATEDRAFIVVKLGYTACLQAALTQMCFTDKPSSLLAVRLFCLTSRVY